jgi:hypothetical protein
MNTFFINYFLELAAFLIGLVLYRKLQPGVFKLLVLLLCITVINEGFSYWGFYKQIQIKKTLIYAFFFIIECTIFWQLFLVKQESSRSFFYHIIFALVVALQGFFLGRYGYQRMNSPFLNVVCLYAIFLGGNYYYKLYVTQQYFDITKDPFFWLATGIVIVNFIHLFYVNAILIKSFSTDPNRVSIFKHLNTIGNVIYYPLLIKTLVCSSKLQKQAITS